MAEINREIRKKSGVGLGNFCWVRLENNEGGKRKDVMLVEVEFVCKWLPFIFFQLGLPLADADADTLPCP